MTLFVQPSGLHERILPPWQAEQMAYPVCKESHALKANTFVKTGAIGKLFVSVQLRLAATVYCAQPVQFCHSQGWQTGLRRQCKCRFTSIDHVVTFSFASDTRLPVPMQLLCLLSKATVVTHASGEPWDMLHPQRHAQVMRYHIPPHKSVCTGAGATVQHFNEPLLSI